MSETIRILWRIYSKVCDDHEASRARMLVVLVFMVIRSHHMVGRRPRSVKMKIQLVPTRTRRAVIVFWLFFYSYTCQASASERNELCGPPISAATDAAFTAFSSYV